MRPFTEQPARDPFQRAVHDLHHHALADEWARIELQIALDKPADAVDLEIGDGSDVAVKRDDVDDARTFQDR